MGSREASLSTVTNSQRATWITEHLKPWWNRCLTTATLAPVLIAGVLGVLYLGRVISVMPDGTAVAMIGLAGLGGIAAVASHRTNV